LPAVTATDARGGALSLRVAQRSTSQQEKCYAVTTKCCPGSAAPRSTLCHRERGAAHEHRRPDYRTPPSHSQPTMSARASEAHWQQLGTTTRRIVAIHS
jgi:hypothetical protein